MADTHGSTLPLARVGRLLTFILVGMIMSACGLLGDSNSGSGWITSDGQRLLSDEAWVWCTANPGEVTSAAGSLGVGTDGDDGLVLEPVEVFRACSAAAGAAGLDTHHPSDDLLAVARSAGFVANDTAVMEAGIMICDAFDEEGVTQLKMSVVVYDTYELLGPLPQNVITDPYFQQISPLVREQFLEHQGKIEDTTFASELVIGAASARVCPEYASEVAAFG